MSWTSWRFLRLACLLSVRPSPLTVQTREVRERSLTVQWTPAFDGGRPVTSYRVDLKSKQGTNTTRTLEGFKVWAVTESCVVQPPGTQRSSLRSWTLSWPSWLCWICVQPGPTTCACLPPTAWARVTPATFWPSQPKKQVELNRTQRFFVERTLSRTVSFAGWVLSTRRSSSGHAAGEPHCSQHQSLVEGQPHIPTRNSVCWVLCRFHQAPRKVWLLPPLAPQAGSHKRAPPRLHHQLQGVQRRRQTV